jgi:hypothetical protein
MEPAPERASPSPKGGYVIVRAPRPTTHFTQVRNDVARDRRLSYKARGLLVTMLSYPDYWRFRVDDLVKGSPDGRHAVTTGLRELEDAGYLKRRKYRLPDGTFASRLVVFDSIDARADDDDDLFAAAVEHPDPVEHNGDTLGITPATMSDYPRRISGDLLEHSPKNNVQRGITGTYNATARLCGKCHGTGRSVVNDDIEHCFQCGGAGIR